MTRPLLDLARISVNREGDDGQQGDVQVTLQPAPPGLDFTVLTVSFYDILCLLLIQN